MATIRSAQSESLATRVLQQLRAAEPKIPPYPAVAGALQKLLREGSSLRDMAAVVAKDAAIAAAVLRAATSAANRAPGVLTLEVAIQRIGIEELTQVVLASGFGATAMRQGPLSVLRRDLWRRSLLSATFCKDLAPGRGLDPDEAFLAGLLHDFGGVVALACVETLSDVPKLPEHGWQKVVDDLHLELGAVVAARWQLPEQIAEVIVHHHAPAAAARAHQPMVALVAAVDAVIEILDRGIGADTHALSDASGLSLDERARILALMPKISEQMAAFEMPADRTTMMQKPMIATTMIPLADSWPVDFVVEGKGHAEHRARMVGPSALVFTSAISYPVAWLADLTLHDDEGNFTILANVKSCVKQLDGTYEVTAQPFGLGGDVQTAWTKLVKRARRAMV